MLMSTSFSLPVYGQGSNELTFHNKGSKYVSKNKVIQYYVLEFDDYHLINIGSIHIPIDNVSVPS